MKGQNKILKIILFLGDFFLAYASLFLALIIRNKIFLWYADNFLYKFMFLYIIWLALIFILNLYDIYFFKKKSDFFFNLIIFSVFAFFTGETYFYFWPTFGITPKSILILNILVFDVIFLCWRYLFNLFLEAKGIKEKIIIIGSNSKLKEILPQINRNYEVIAFFNFDAGTGDFAQKENSISSIEELKNIVVQKKVSSVLLAMNLYPENGLVKKNFSNLPLTLNYIDFNDLYEIMTKKLPIRYLDEAWFLQKISRPENKLEQIVKRICDIILSLIGLAIFIILFPFIAFTIKLEDKGSIFYSQNRVGVDGEVFRIYKFRTMTENKNQDKEVWREKKENNITKAGKILRRLHFDELPQVWNIFKGDLSFVGPRAEWTELAKDFEKEIPFYKQRYLVKPGLIGWAQINFPPSKSIEEAKEKFEYDLYYIKNHSLLLDMEIILKAAKLFLW